MKRLERATSFLFDPARFKNDPAVQRMEPAARGGYAMLFCEGWDQVEPGVFIDDDAVLAHLARLERPEWDRLRPQIAAAFDTESRPGFWVQKGTIATHLAQSRRFKSKSASGIAGANARWGKGQDATAIPDEMAPASEQECDRNGSRARGVRLGKDSEEEESKERGAASPPAAPAAQPNGREAAPDENQVRAFALIASVAGPKGLGRTGPGTPLMDAVKRDVAALAPAARARLFQLAGWLAKTGVRDDECVLRFVADAMPRLPQIRNLIAYYAVSGAARASIEGHYRAETQERESARWREEDWAWMRRMRAYQEQAQPP